MKHKPLPEPFVGTLTETRPFVISAVTLVLARPLQLGGV